MTQLAEKFQAGGSIVSSPSFFKILDSANKPSVGVAGEAGPEAILPLRRMRGGELGVLARIAAREDREDRRGGGPTVFIDARGADRQGLQELKSYVERLDGTLEFRASRVLEAMVRRTA